MDGRTSFRTNVWFGRLAFEWTDELEGGQVNCIGGRFGEWVDGCVGEQAKVDRQNLRTKPLDRIPG